MSKAIESVQKKQSESTAPSVTHQIRNKSALRIFFVWHWLILWGAGAIGSSVFYSHHAALPFLIIPSWAGLLGTLYFILDYGYGVAAITLGSAGLQWEKRLFGRILETKSWPLAELIDIKTGFTTHKSSSRTESRSYYVKFITNGLGLKFSEEKSERICREWTLHFGAILQRLKPQASQFGDIEIKRIFPSETSAVTYDGPPSDSRWTMTDETGALKTQQLSFQKKTVFKLPTFGLILAGTFFCLSILHFLISMLFGFPPLTYEITGVGPEHKYIFVALALLMAIISFFSLKAVATSILNAFSLITYTFSTNQIKKTRTIFKRDFSKIMAIKNVKKISINPPGELDKKNRVRTDSLPPDDEYQLKLFDDQGSVTIEEDYTLGEASWMAQEIAKLWQEVKVADLTR